MRHCQKHTRGIQPAALAAWKGGSLGETPDGLCWDTEKLKAEHCLPLTMGAKRIFYPLSLTSAVGPGRRDRCNQWGRQNVKNTRVSIWEIFWNNYKKKDKTVQWQFPGSLAAFMHVLNTCPFYVKGLHQGWSILSKQVHRAYGFSWHLPKICY